jgi:two-component system OmpR family sensor kinase
MSSSRPAELGRRVRHWLAGWSLRTRLVAALLTLVGAVCVTVAVATDVALHDFLVRQLDAQVDAASHRAVAHLDLPAPGSPDGKEVPPPGFAPGQAAATFSAVVNRTVRTAGALDASGVGQRAPTSVYQTLLDLPADGRHRTRDLGSLGEYRLVAIPGPDGDGSVIITGLPMSGVDETLGWLVLVEIGVTLFGVALAGLAGTVIVRGTLRPLRRVAATAGRVSELPLDRGEVALAVRVPDHDTDPRTEVGQVGAALNRMLGHVAGALSARHASEMRVRQFVADASHELRTPLAAIRGYAELARRVPADAPHALNRVESESARMTTLVEDLLLLARLDSGRPLEHAPVDLSRLVVDAVSDAHVAGPGHKWRLDLPEEPVTVTGDGLRLHQVLANLLGNARVHAPPGTSVTVGLTPPGDGEVRLTVRDDGPGILPTLLPDVFERFARGDTSRSRAVGSTGLGLSIVAAVVHAHGGRVEVASRPGETVFTVVLSAANGPAPDSRS